MHTPAEDAFLRAVCADPDNDAPRLIYADWLDETGDRAKSTQAEFIRTQVHLASRKRGIDRPALEHRVWVLLHAHGGEWVEPLGMKLFGVRFERGFIESARTHSDFVLDEPQIFARHPVRTLECVLVQDCYDAMLSELGRRSTRRRVYQGDLWHQFLNSNVDRHQLLIQAGGRAKELAECEFIRRVKVLHLSVR